MRCRVQPRLEVLMEDEIYDSALPSVSRSLPERELSCEQQIATMRQCFMAAADKALSNSATFLLDWHLQGILQFGYISFKALFSKMDKLD